MSLAKNSFVVLLVFASNLLLAQTATDTLLAKDNVMIPLPTVSLNFGISNSFSDVKLGSNGPSAFKQFGYQLTITQRVTKFLNASLNLYTGTIYGEQQIGQTNLNYRTTLFSQHVNIEYNFYPLLKPNDDGRQLIRPYIGFGLGMLSFRSKGDLKDDKGRKYWYWSDGTINAEEQGTVDATEATRLERDFQYETDLRDANLDELRKYPQLAFSLPLNAGIRFQVSKNIGLNAAFAYSFNFSDMLDNVSSAGIGNRKGSSGYDNHLYGSVGLSIFLGVTKPSAKPSRTFEETLVAEETKSDQTPSTKSEEEKIDKNDLAAISERLKKASESIIQIAESSETFLSKKSNELSKITNREIESKKELREAKKESIAVLDSSMAALKSTGTGLIEATSDLNSAYTDFTDKKFDTRPSSTNKVKNTIEAKIPAIEALKSQVESAKSAEELKAVLNITSKNLTHTNDIFKNESSRINQSILDSRKTVVEARVQQLKSDVQNIGTEQNDGVISDAETSSSITTELDKLLEEGVLNKLEYNQLTSTTKQSEETILARVEDNKSVESTTTKDPLASTTDLLKTASDAIAEKTETAEQSLDAYNQQILSLTQQEVKTKRDLNQIKQQAIELIDKSSSALIETNERLNSVTENLKQVNLTLPKSEQIHPRFTNTDELKAAIEEVIPRLDASKSKIQSAKTSEALKQVLRSTNVDLTKTSAKLSDEKSRVSLASLQTRKNLMFARINQLSSESVINPAELISISNELELLQIKNILSKRELATQSDALNSLRILSEKSKTTAESAEENSVANQQTATIDKTSTNAQAIHESNEPVIAKTDNQVDKPRTIAEIENTPPKESGGFMWADLNENGMISPNEVLHFIDLLFEGEPVRTVTDIQNLIDYYFDQE